MSLLEKVQNIIKQQGEPPATPSGALVRKVNEHIIKYSKGEIAQKINDIEINYKTELMSIKNRYNSDSLIQRDTKKLITKINRELNSLLDILPQDDPQMPEILAHMMTLFNKGDIGKGIKISQDRVNQAFVNYLSRLPGSEILKETERMLALLDKFGASRKNKEKLMTSVLNYLKEQKDNGVPKVDEKTDHEIAFLHTDPKVIVRYIFGQGSDAEEIFTNDGVDALAEYLSNLTVESVKQGVNIGDFDMTAFINKLVSLNR